MTDIPNGLTSQSPMIKSKLRRHENEMRVGGGEIKEPRGRYND